MNALTPLEPGPSSALTPATEARRRHGALHRAVSWSVVGAATGGLVAGVLGLVPGLGEFVRHLFVPLSAAGAFAGVAMQHPRGQRARVGGSASLLGAAAGLAWWLPWAPVAAGLIGLSAVPVLGEGERKRRKLLTGVVAGGFGYAGLSVAARLFGGEAFLGLLPGPLAAAAASAAAGLFVGLSTAPRHLIRDEDPVDVAFADALALRDGELHELLERALGVHRALRAEPAANPAGSAVGLEGRVGEQVLRILRIVEHCRQIDRELAGDNLARLDDRVAVLERKAASTMDPSARATYEEALESLGAQREALKRLGEGRERVVARLHVNVAQLEKLRVSLLQIRSADAERFGSEDGTVMEALEDLGRELDATAAAISEVFSPAALPASSS